MTEIETQEDKRTPTQSRTRKDSPNSGTAKNNPPIAPADAESIGVNVTMSPESKVQRSTITSEGIGVQIDRSPRTEVNGVMINAGSTGIKIKGSSGVTIDHDFVISNGGAALEIGDSSNNNGKPKR